MENEIIMDLFVVCVSILHLDDVKIPKLIIQA